MRQARLKADPAQSSAFYHCVSRIVDRRFVLGETEKAQFLKYLTLYAAFCEVNLITYCLLSNHFHVLVEVPQRPPVLPSDADLIAKVKRLHGAAAAQRLQTFLATWTPEDAQQLRQRYFARMWDVSQFMKVVKQRFTQWYNGRHDRRGTLWEDRFHSVLVDRAGPALVTMAAYIDLNPVRAGLVSDPKDYRWCGYAEAVAGRRRGRQGIQRVMAAWQGGELQEPAALERYRVWLFGQGQAEGVAAPDGRGTPIRRGLDREAVLAVVKARGKLKLPEYVRCRVRYFTAGAVLGTAAFVNGVFATHRDRFGAKRQDGARRLKFLDHPGLFSLRNLRLNPVS